MKVFGKLIVLIMLVVAVILLSSGCGSGNVFALGPNLPKEQGGHFDLGWGWDKNVSVGWQANGANGTPYINWPGTSGDSLFKRSNLVKGNSVRYLYNLSQLQAENLNRTRIEPYTTPGEFVRQEGHDNFFAATNDMSNIKVVEFEKNNNYILFKFKFVSPGYYHLTTDYNYQQEYGFILFKVE